MAGIKVNEGTIAPAGSTKLEVGCEFIRNKIRSGEWKPGHKLPSQTVWASGTPGLKLLYGTLRSCYIVLRTEGWLRGQQGDGVYVDENPPVEELVPTTKRTKRS